MITKAIIKQLYTTEDNHYLVYIPLFQKANLSQSDATLPATALSISGINRSLKVNDVVYVSFENNNFSKPIILGKLFLGKENKEEIDINITAKSQEILESAKLPANTKIGNIDIQDICNLMYNFIENRLSAEDIIYVNDKNFNVQSKLDELSAENDKLKEELIKIKEKINI